MSNRIPTDKVDKIARCHVIGVEAALFVWHATSHHGVARQISKANRNDCNGNGNGNDDGKNHDALSLVPSKAF